MERGIRVPSMSSLYETHSDQNNAFACTLYKTLIQPFTNKYKQKTDEQQMHPAYNFFT